MAEAVKVLVRCRPMNEREKKLNCGVVVQTDPKIAQVQLIKPSGSKEQVPPKLFTFDGVYYTEDTTQQIYGEMCFSLVSGVLEGYNGTVFAYGQTGCGKSFSMMGVEDPPANKGVIPRAFEHIFDHVAVTSDIKFLVRASYLEIYNEEVRDLLGKDAKKKLDLHEHPEKGVYVQGLSMHKVHNVSDLERVMELGSKNRSVGATLMNVDSSRSHSIFSIDVEMLEGVAGGEDKLRVGRLNLVDLAGSERQSKTGSTGERLKEATKINLSLSALGNVISALVDGKSKHVPYRDSKLTRLLQSSLGGNTKTLMIACVSPADNNYDETLSTLRYANRAKNIKNKPKINEDPKDALLREYQEEIKKLKMMLMGQMEVPTDLQGGAVPVQSRAPLLLAHQSVESEEDMAQSENSGPSEDLLRKWEEEKQAIRREYERRIAELQEQFGQEQADKTRIQTELEQLQKDWDEQLNEAQDRFNMSVTISPSKSQRHIKPSSTSPQHQHHSSGRTGTPVSGMSAQLSQIEDTTTLSEVSTEHGQSNDDQLVSELSKDRQVLKEHEAALKRLEELQKDMIGGEKAGDDSLRKHLDERRLIAEERQSNLQEATSIFDDDGIMERIFNNLTDEVRVKTHHIEKLQMKVRSAEEDIKDLHAEFEIERQDYLDTIRNQDKKLKLYEQLLRTVVPCLRRDCNYFNIDKVMDDARWNDDQAQWVLPKLVITKPNLSPVNSKATLLDKRGAHSSNMGKQASTPEVRNGATLSKGLHSSNSAMLQSGGYESQEDDHKLITHLQKFGQPEYFKPKRALELLGQTKENSSPEHSSSLPGLDTSLSSRKANSTTNLQPSAAAVHGIDIESFQSTGDSMYNRRPGKLQSLAGKAPLPTLNSLTLSPNRSRSQQNNMDLLEKVEKRLSNRKKNSLEPLGEIKGRKPPL